MNIENELPPDSNGTPEEERTESAAIRVGRILTKTALATAWAMTTAAVTYANMKYTR